MHINSCQPSFKGEYSVKRDVSSPNDLALLHYIADRSHSISKYSFVADKGKGVCVPIEKVNYDYDKMNIVCNNFFDTIFENDLQTLGINFDKQG